jgi:hypothetical protein
VPHVLVLAVLGADRYPPFRLDTGGDEPAGPADQDRPEVSGPVERPSSPFGA